MSEAGGSETFRIRIRKIHIYLVVGLLIGFAAGLLVTRALLHGPQGSPAANPDARQGFASSPIVDVAIEGRPFRGPESAQLTIVEFTDYECPFCAQYFRETYRQLLSVYEGKLKYVVRNFPIPELHPHAQKAAEAAECAHEQGRFWEYHDLLFQRTPDLDVESLIAYTRGTEIDAGVFESCLRSGRMGDLVVKDVQDGIAYGVSATPTFFLNGRRVIGALSLDEVAVYIDLALQDTAAQAAGE